MKADGFLRYFLATGGSGTRFRIFQRYRKSKRPIARNPARDEADRRGNQECESTSPMLRLPRALRYLRVCLSRRARKPPSTTGFPPSPSTFQFQWQIKQRDVQPPPTPPLPFAIPAHPRDRSIAGDVNTTNVPLALLTVSPISLAPPLRFSPDSIPLRPPVYHELFTSVPVILSSLIALSSSSTCHLICRPPFRVFSFLVVPISFDFFQPFPIIPFSRFSRACCPTVICPWQEKDSRSQGYAARVPIFRYANAGDRTGERAGGQSDCMRHEKNRPRKSECSYQSAMQTRGFASVMLGERERKKDTSTQGDADVWSVGQRRERSRSVRSDNCVV